jgi:hypothetical protein
MAFVRIRVQGVAQAQATLRQAFANQVHQVAADLATALRANTPVRTGRAQGGWRVRNNKLSATISNKVPYVQYLDQGTPRMRAANKGSGIIGPSLKSIKGKIK